MHFSFERETPKATNSTPRFECTEALRAGNDKSKYRVKYENPKEIWAERRVSMGMEALYVMGMFELDESVERICLVQLEGKVIDGQDI
jgi:hypothetical protein